jgi:alpha-beta hydrolase superfamily lysophospholipase
MRGRPSWIAGGEENRMRKSTVSRRRFITAAGAGGAALALGAGTGGAGAAGPVPQTGEQAAQDAHTARHLFFDHPLFEGWAHALVTIYQCPLGEVAATAARIPEGDYDTWYAEWVATGDRVVGYGDASLAHGHTVSAREAYRRASLYYATAYRPLYGAPLDPRLIAAFEMESGAFLKAAPLMTPPVEPVEIPYEGTTLPGLFIRASAAQTPQKTMIVTSGYDSTIYMLYIDYLAAVRRGYNVLLFDGPGQGRALFQQGLVMRPDWEHVVTPVVDYALSRPEVDPNRVALHGISLGGYTAPRAASGEQRLAAVIADPGLWSVFEAIPARLALPEEVKQQLPNVDPAVLEPFVQASLVNPVARWTLQQRAFMVHGVTTLLEYLRLAREYSLEAVVGQIRCPTLLTQAESDPLAANAGRIYDALRSPKALIRFTNAEGAGEHCEASNRPLFDQRVYDWLDEVLGA